MEINIHQKLILLVEDSDDDYEVTARAFRKTSNCHNPIHRCEDGQEALDFLLHQGKYADPKTAPRPCIILLDLNLPGINGIEVLKTIKTTDELKDIPVVVLTTSDDIRDVEECYREGANTYIKKPVDLNNFYEAIKRLEGYWFEIAILPKS